MRTFVVGDIHGYRETLAALCRKLDLKAGDTLIAVGDYIDRGPNSFGVVELLLELQHQGVHFRGLLGNHETALFDALGMQDLLPPDVACHGYSLSIRKNGFKETAKSYGWNYLPMLHNLDCVKLPEHHIQFFQSLEQFVLLPGFLIVHAHLGRGALRKPTAEEAVHYQLKDMPSTLQHERDTLEHPKVFPELLIHGHTPIHTLSLPGTYTKRQKDDVRVVEGRLNLDSGIHRGGPLSAVELPSLRIIQQANID